MIQEKNKFMCIECQKMRFPRHFIDQGNELFLTNKCNYCQKKKDSPVKIKKREKNRVPNENEKKCRRCLSIKDKDEFIRMSKNGDKWREVLTCQKCRELDLKLRKEKKNKKENEQKNNDE